MPPYPPASAYSQTTPETAMDPQQNASGISGAVGNAHTAMATENSDGDPMPPYATVIYSALFGNFVSTLYGIDITNIPTSVPTPPTLEGLTINQLYASGGTITFSLVGAAQIPGVATVRLISDDGAGVNLQLLWNGFAYAAADAPTEAWFVSRDGLQTTFQLEIE